MSKGGQESQKCGRCGAEEAKLTAVTTGLKLALKTTNTNEIHHLPELVCTNCYADLTSQVSQGMRLRLDQEARDKNKVLMWKGRTNLIKQARVLMAKRAYSEAAISYEKYIRVLEMVYNLQRGELSPSVFNSSKRSKELTVVASVYWDLIRIYDTSPRFEDRMIQAAAKLAQFLPLSPIYPDIIKKAELFLKTARNPNVVRGFLKSSKITRVGCFIATAVFVDPQNENVVVLRKFRDQVLLQYSWGRSFVAWYYEKSPVYAEWLKTRSKARQFLKPIFRLIAVVVKKSLKCSPESFKS